MAKPHPKRIRKPRARVVVRAPQTNPASDGPEIIVGLVSPVGSNLHCVVAALQDELAAANYGAIVVKVSSLLHQLQRYEKLGQGNSSEYHRIKRHMKAGTELRTTTGNGGIMALLATGEIRQRRFEENIKRGLRGEEAYRIPLPRTAYILDSLKHPDEIHTLRDVYGDAFFVVSAYAPREYRVEALAERLAASEQNQNSSMYRSKAEDLISIDEAEEGNKLGQDVSDAFPLADLFVDSRSKDQVRLSISRFLDALFKFPYSTPTRDEFAMFIAKSSALRSADLGRQVGAAITDNEGDIIALGCNEVPKASGGLYWTGDAGDQRDFVLGYDTSVKYKREILAELLGRLRSARWLASSKSQKTPDEMVEDLLSGNAKKVLHGAQITNLLEYGRSVHAEMAALSDAAKRGNSVAGGTLYTTTFPCHLCARHIVAAGIHRVVYIEPYPKSQTKRLYPDSIVIDPAATVHERVHFEPFVGIAPTQYTRMFTSRNNRKDGSTGKAVEWNRSHQQPDVRVFPLSYLLVEEQFVGKQLPEILSRARLRSVM